ncbi:MAG TPA: DUF4296 domain-containing protein [Chitinophagaceae bacterium]|nr:DUF4296 domain-containing protein [Chitinophagaceae bacterium]
MRIWLPGAAIICLFISCTRKDSLPAGILSQKKMQTIMWDMMRADQFLADYVFNKDTSINKTGESLKYYQQVFTIHQITEKDFQKSFYYYRLHPGQFKSIMDSLSQVPEEAPTPVMNHADISDSISTNQVKPFRPDTATRFKRIRQVN